MKLTDVFSIAGLQGVIDELSEFAGIPLFFADVDGNIVTRIDNLQSVCTAFSKDEHRPCAACPRRQIGQTNFDWSMDDLVQSYPCPSGMLEIAIPILLKGEPLGVLGSVQVVKSPEEIERVGTFATSNGFTQEQRDRFASSIQVYEEIRLVALQAIGQAVVRLMVTAPKVVGVHAGPSGDD